MLYVPVLLHDRSSSEAYALAFEFVAPPPLHISPAPQPGLLWPVYPGGFMIEWRTNLVVGSWQTNNVPFPGFTNGQNNIPLNTTNAAQFFRLRRPNI